MEKIIFATTRRIAALVFGFFVVVLLGSCSSMVQGSYRPFSELTDAEIIGTVEIKSVIPHTFVNREQAREETYTKLLEEARKKYPGEGAIDVCNITITLIYARPNMFAGDINATAKVVRIGPDLQFMQPSAVSQPVVAEDPVTPPDDDFEVRQNRDGVTVTITGYKGSARNIIIPQTLYGLPVTAIADKAFFRTNLTNVVISGSIPTIGRMAFAANQLTSLTLENGVTTIGSLAFSGLNDIVKDAAGNESLRYSSFSPRNKLTSVTIPDSVTTIGSSAFSNNQLTSITFGNGVTTIEAGVFSDNQLASLTIPDSVTTIGNGAFSGNKLTSLTLGNGITFIGVDAFEKNQLTSLTIPGGVTTIRGGAFRDNKLTSLIIPDSVTTIGGGVNSASVSGSTDIGGSGPGAFSNNQLTGIILGRGLNVIHNGTFSDNQLTSITIAKDVPARSVSAVINHFNSSITAPGIGAGAGFEQNFINFYESQGRSPGTYVKNGPIWQKQ